MKRLIARLAWGLYCWASNDRRIAGPRRNRNGEWERWDPRRCEVAVSELRPTWRQA